MSDGRYQRQSAMLGDDGQARLATARVLVIGAGGLGSPLLYYLAAAGVGHLTIIDDDRVSLSNLNRQILYTQADIGQLKAELAAQRLRALNPGIIVDTVTARFERENGRELVAACDIAALAVDNPDTRLLANSLSVELGKPLVDGGIDQWYGYVTVVRPGISPCLACWSMQGSGSQSQSVSFGPVAGIIGSMEALAVIELLLGKPVPTGQRLMFDGARWELQAVELDRRPDCDICASD